MYGSEISSRGGGGGGGGGCVQGTAIRKRKKKKKKLQHVPAVVGLERLDRLVGSGLTDTRQCDAFGGLLRPPPAEAPVQVDGPVL